MKEEVGMNRWRPSGTLAALAAAGMLAVSASTAMAVSDGSPYTNVQGISTANTEATMTLNPGLSGQWLWGTYYDVRPVKNGSTGATGDTNLANNTASLAITVGAAAQPIPTLSQWAAMLMTLLLGFLAVRRLNRQQ